MRILLTGACGYVGTKLYQRLKNDGHEVSGVDVKWFYSDQSIDTYDVREMTSPIREWGDPATEVIIHLAAISNDPSVSYYPRLSWETSVLATQQLAQWAAKNKCRFIYASSVSVYGADRGLVSEDMEVYPLSDYNKTKMCAERVLLSYPEIRPQIIRPATICGLSPRMRLDLTVNLLTMQGLTKGVLTVHGGKQWRPSIHIDDMVELYCFMLARPDLIGVWNAGFENHTILQIAERVADHIPVEIRVTREQDRRSYMVNSAKLLAAGFSPRKSVATAIQEICDAYHAGKLTDMPQHYNLGWMTHLGVKDE